MQNKIYFTPLIVTFFILVFSGKIKFGSSGEYVNNEAKSKIPQIDIIIPKISANLFMIKLINKLAVFLIFIYVNQLYHFVSSNFCC